MKCRTEGCGHRRTRRSVMTKEPWWEKYQICTCCAIELEVPEAKTALPIKCTREILLELNPPKTRTTEQKEKLRMKNFAKRDEFLKRVGLR